MLWDARSPWTAAADDSDVTQIRFTAFHSAA